MILTVTINPLLENRFYFDNVKIGCENRASKTQLCAGGKGINVCRQLNFLGLKNLGLTFVGGSNGKKLRQVLADEQINISPISTKSETRSASIIIEENKNQLTTYFEPNSNITYAEVKEIKSKLEKMILNCSTVVFSGSSPCAEADDIFEFGIELAHKHDKVSILDTYGAHLNKCIEAAPTIIHNNISEISRSLDIDLSSEEAKLDFLHSLYKKGIKLAFLTNGNEQIYSSKYDFIYKTTPPKIDALDSTGSGDAFVAGVTSALEKSMIFDDILKYATAVGALNASSWDICKVDPNNISSMMENIQTVPIGKKMKIIDDSPNYNRD